VPLHVSSTAPFPSLPRNPPLPEGEGVESPVLLLPPPFLVADDGMSLGAAPFASCVHVVLLVVSSAGDNGIMQQRSSTAIEIEQLGGGRNALEGQEMHVPPNPHASPSPIPLYRVLLGPKAAADLGAEEGSPWPFIPARSRRSPFPPLRQHGPRRTTTATLRSTIASLARATRTTKPRRLPP
jgi:hypothetical protein